MLKDIDDTVSGEKVNIGNRLYKVAKELLKLLPIDISIKYLWKEQLWGINKLLF